MSRMVLPWNTWRHVVKLDPDRPITDSELSELGTIGTDAVLVGGTQRITYEKTAALLRRLRACAPELIVWQEISEQTAICPEMDGFGIPVVVNAGNPEWIIGRHATAIKWFGKLIPWDRVVTEAYIIFNSDAAVAKLTQAMIPGNVQEAAAYAIASERILGIDVVYLEYSGTYGSPEWIRELRTMSTAHLVYGGGIDTGEKAAAMAAHADTIVVGNALYEKGIEVVRETVHAVREAGPVKKDPP